MLTQKLFHIVILVGYWFISVPFMATFAQDNILTAQEPTEYIWQYLLLFFVFVVVYFIIIKIFDNCFKNYEVREKVRKIQIRKQLELLERGDIDLEQASDILKLVHMKNSPMPRRRPPGSPALCGRRTAPGSPALGGRKTAPGSPALGGRKLPPGSPALGGRKLPPGSPALGGRKLPPGSPALGGRKLGPSNMSGRFLAPGSPALGGRKSAPSSPALGGRKMGTKLKKGYSLKSMDALCDSETEILGDCVDGLPTRNPRVRKIRRSATAGCRTAPQSRDSSPCATINRRRRAISPLAATSMSTLPPPPLPPSYDETMDDNSIFINVESSEVN